MSTMIFVDVPSDKESLCSRLGTQLSIHHRLFDMRNDLTGNILSTCVLDAFQSRRCVDYKHERATAGAQQIKPGNAQPP